jgi:hypothetical protein
MPFYLYYRMGLNPDVMRFLLIEFSGAPKDMRLVFLIGSIKFERRKRSMGKIVKRHRRSFY